MHDEYSIDEQASRCADSRWTHRRAGKGFDRFLAVIDPHAYVNAATTAIHDAAVGLGRGLLTVPTSPRVIVNSLESFSSKRECRKMLRLQSFNNEEIFYDYCVLRVWPLGQSHAIEATTGSEIFAIHANGFSVDMIETSSCNRVWIIAITAIHDAAVGSDHGFLTVPTSLRVIVNSLESLNLEQTRTQKKASRLQGFKNENLLRLTILS